MVKNTGLVVLMFLVIFTTTAKADFKAYMDYRTITDETTKQWELQQDAWTDENGLRRYGDTYMVAVGSYYAEECGGLLEIQLQENAITAIVGDIRKDSDTVNGKESKYNLNSILEFIVDTDYLCETCKELGDVSHCVGNDVVKISKGE